MARTTGKNNKATKKVVKTAAKRSSKTSSAGEKVIAKRTPKKKVQESSNIGEKVVAKKTPKKRVPKTPNTVEKVIAKRTSKKKLQETSNIGEKVIAKRVPKEKLQEASDKGEKVIAKRIPKEKLQEASNMGEKVIAKRVPKKHLQESSDMGEKVIAKRTPKKKIQEQPIVEEKSSLDVVPNKSIIKSEYYKGLDLLRVIACLAVLLYHLNILKGGYLAVCTFFVFTGFLACRSAFKRSRFSLVEYYKNRFIKLYIPLIIVVFITILVASISTSMSWFNIKPDATSVLLGYNNFWQISANLDYFARHINSPFMHFWYIGILLQFELIFPIIYKLFKTIGDKIRKEASYIIPFILSIISFIFFYYMSFKDNLMGAYYNSFYRAFSILFGLAFGFMYSYMGSTVKKSPRVQEKNKKVFISYLLILILLFIFVDSKSIFFSISMMFVTVISCRLIDYCLVSNKKKLSKFDIAIKNLANISYEIYLIQYPVIYMFQFINIEYIIKVPIIIILVIILAYILHICVDLKHRFKNVILNYMKYLISIVIVFISLFGMYKYFNLVDYTDEMKELEEILAQNEKDLLKHQDEYLNKIQEEQASWEEVLNGLEDDDEKIKSVVDKLKVVGVGDSIMLGAVPNLYSTFKNGYFDAKVSRSIWSARDILSDLSKKKMLGDVVLINLGANGDCSASCKKEIIEKSGDRKVFFITVTNDDKVHVNDKFKALAEEYENVYIIDWAEYSKGHTEYFYADKIHLNGSGRKAYAQLVYDTLFEVYKNEYKAIKEKLLEEHDKELKSKISFYGNDILLSSYDEILRLYPEALIVPDKNYSFKKLKDRLKNDKKNGTLSYRLVLLFDFKFRLTKEEYEEIIELCDNNELYILSTNKITTDLLSSIQSDRLHIIDFYSEIKNHDEYLMNDYIHLTDEGVKALIDILKGINS